MAYFPDLFLVESQISTMVTGLASFHAHSIIQAFMYLLYKQLPSIYYVNGSALCTEHTVVNKSGKVSDYGTFSDGSTQVSSGYIVK